MMVKVYVFLSEFHNLTSKVHSCFEFYKDFLVTLGSFEKWVFLIV